MDKEYIDLEAAREYVEANYQGDPLLRTIYGVLLEKLPRVRIGDTQEDSHG